MSIFTCCLLKTTLTFSCSMSAIAEDLRAEFRCIVWATLVLRCCQLPDALVFSLNFVPSTASAGAPLQWRLSVEPELSDLLYFCLKSASLWLDHNHLAPFLSAAFWFWHRMAWWWRQLKNLWSSPRWSCCFPDFNVAFYAFCLTGLTSQAIFASSCAWRMEGLK